jgi:hypothetical protein
LDGLDVADVSPPGGPTFGGQRVTLRGQGFEPGTEVWFGEVRSPWVEVYHQGELGAVLPPRVHGGPVDVRVVSPRGDERLLPGAFTYALTTRANVDTTNDDLPYVVGAASIGPTTVEVNFSEPMTAASLASAGHYWIGGDFVDASTLIVVSAEASADGRTAILTTMAQSEINYTIVVSGVTTAAGVGLLAWDQLGGGGPYNVAEFPGTAETGLPTDTDGDGVSDALEQRGAEVNVTRLDGTTAGSMTARSGRAGPIRSTETRTVTVARTATRWSARASSRPIRSIPTPTTTALMTATKSARAPIRTTPTQTTTAWTTTSRRSGAPPPQILTPMTTGSATAMRGRTQPTRTIPTPTTMVSTTVPS